MTAFSRANGMRAAIMAAIAGMTSPFDIQAALSGFQYKSRGHGGKFHKRQVNAHNAHPSKYRPHQGKQECARRVVRGVNYG